MLCRFENRKSAEETHARGKRAGKRRRAIMREYVSLESPYRANSVHLFAP